MSTARNPLPLAKGRFKDLLRATDLYKFFPIRRGFFRRVVGHVHAVNGVSFSLTKGKILGICGESGCGKSTLGRMLVQLLEPSKGSIYLEGRDYALFTPAEKAHFHTRVQLVFQDPYSALNPRMNIEENLTLPLSRGPLALFPSDAKERMEEALTLVGLGGDLLASTCKKYPHQFSGGQQQRICLARALSVRPQVLILDEVLSALDLSIQAQVLQLLLDLRSRLELTLVFISHDLATIAHLCDEVAVMYLGQIVERGPVQELFTSPLHPYTQSLMASLPGKESAVSSSSLPIVQTEPSSNVHLPKGCFFHPRCPKAQPSCRLHAPDPKKVGSRRAYRCIL